MYQIKMLFPIFEERPKTSCKTVVLPICTYIFAEIGLQGKQQIGKCETHANLWVIR